MSYADIKAAILKLANERPNVSFIDLTQNVPGFKGEEMLAVAGYPTLILWHAISAEGIAAIGDLLKEGAIVLRITNSRTYWPHPRPQFNSTDRLFAYKRPRWLPTLLIRKPKD